MGASTWGRTLAVTHVTRMSHACHTTPCAECRLLMLQTRRTGVSTGRSAAGLELWPVRVRMRGGARRMEVGASPARAITLSQFLLMHHALPCSLHSTGLYSIHVLPRGAFLSSIPIFSAFPPFAPLPPNYLCLPPYPSLLFPFPLSSPLSQALSHSHPLTLSLITLNLIALPPTAPSPAPRPP